ncbi:MAG: hypothetical protein L0H22_04145 [Brevibacterium aurantiacum]|nr:hypothetical protein [Brevibacterium aurantiacum]
MPTELERLSSDYERHEAAFIRAVAERLPYQRLGDLADATVAAANMLSAEAHRALFAGETAWMPLGELAEACEQMATLWTDLADAYAGRPPRSANPNLL